jgi:hypothetical protein
VLTLTFSVVYPCKIVQNFVLAHSEEGKKIGGGVNRKGGGVNHLQNEVRIDLAATKVAVRY